MFASVPIDVLEDVTSFRLSVRRGYCSTCGSRLFCDPVEKEWIAWAVSSSPTVRTSRSISSSRQGRLLQHRRRLAAKLR
jgi:hypothetical protein